MVTKLDFIQHNKLSNQTTALRELLQAADNNSIRLLQKGKDGVLAQMERLDQIQALIADLDTDHADLRAEKSQLDTAISRFLKDAPGALRLLGGTQALAAARPDTVSPVTHPWWFMDRHVAERRALQVRQWRRIGITAAVILAVLLVLFNTVLKPDPRVVAAKTHYEQALTVLSRDLDYDTALQEANEALAIIPDDFETLILKGVILELTGEDRTARSIFEQAGEIAPQPEYVPLGRGRLMLQLNRIEAAFILAEEAIALNEDFAEGWFLLGQAQSMLGQTPEAFASFEKASELALEQENDTLYAIIRVNMGYMASPGGGGVGP